MQELVAPFANHLWQSTAFVAAVAGICLALRNHSPRLRYWLWLAASLKFLIPFSMLLSLGASFEQTAESVPALQARTVAQAAYAFSPAPVSVATVETQVETTAWPAALFGIWAVGFVGIAGWRFRQWRALHLVRRRGQSVPLAFPAPVVEADSLIEPGIFGMFGPVLLLPRGLRQQLTDEQFQTLITHELCHLRHRDNLTAAIHMAVEAVFWFFPLVWWIGSKLVAERERACDQSVLAQGGSAEVYATSILNVCRGYLESPLPCAPGITGSDLKKRIQEIMAGRAGRPLNAMRKAALTVTAIAAISLPVAIGILRAQTLPPPPEYTYEVVSVRPADPSVRRTLISPGPQGGMRAQSAPVMMLLTYAYDVSPEVLVDIPDWAKTERFDVTFTADREEVTGPDMTEDQRDRYTSRQRQRWQAVLRDRFGLVLRAESQERPMYALTIARGGPKLTPAAKDGPQRRLRGRGRITATDTDMKTLAGMLSSQLGRPVVDETGLEGSYDFVVEFAPDGPMLGPAGTPSPQGGPAGPPTSGGGPSIFTALTEQIGLKLESRKAPVPVLVVEKIERPEAN